MTMSKPRASVLMSALWILAMLVLFVIGLGYRGLLDLKITRYQRDRLRASLLAQAAVNKTIALLKQDGADPLTSAYDTRAECGVNLAGRQPEELFSERDEQLDDGFNVGYTVSAGQLHSGPADEARRINLNVMPLLNRQIVLGELLRSCEIDDPQELAAIAIQWTDPSTVDITLAKRAPLRRPEELMLAWEYWYLQRGLDQQEAAAKARQAYVKAEKYLTVYGDGRLNLNTVDSPVFDALLTALITTDPEFSSAPLTFGPLVPVIVEAVAAFCREGIFDSLDPDAITAKLSAGLTPEQQVQVKTIFSKLTGVLSVKATAFRITVNAFSGKALRHIIAVYDRQENKLVGWQQW